MKELIIWLVVAYTVQGKGLGVEDMDRACPDGYFYGGEVPHDSSHETRGQVWEKGPTSPVYSCYRRIKSEENGDLMDWVTASRVCSKAEGHLLSVNNYEETKVLGGDLFLRKYLGKECEDNVTLPVNVTTSGISLTKDHWIWFGAGESEPSDVDKSITENLTKSDNFTTYCLVVSFSNISSSVNLTYTAVPCLDTFSEAICEVRVYEQVWYVWFTTNWMQILFLLTLVMLLISTCITFQIWVSRPSRRSRTSRVNSSTSSNPPPYTPREQTPTSTKAWLGATANKYTDKGKEIMGKVVFIRKPEDKERIVTEA